MFLRHLTGVGLIRSDTRAASSPITCRRNGDGGPQPNFARKKFTFHYRLSLRDISPTLLEDTRDTCHVQARAGILVSLDLPCQAKDEMDLLHFVGLRKTRRESALATTESALRRSAPGPWILAATSIILNGWNEA